MFNMMFQPYHVQLASKRASNWADSTDEVTFTLGAVSDTAPKEGEPGEPDKACCSCLKFHCTSADALPQSFCTL